MDQVKVSSQAQGRRQGMFPSMVGLTCFPLALEDDERSMQQESKRADNHDVVCECVADDTRGFADTGPPVPLALHRSFALANHTASLDAIMQSCLPGSQSAKKLG